jgi:hypothetical protein
MTQFQALAILLPVFGSVIVVVFALWMQYLDRAPTDKPGPSKPAEPEH